MTSAGANGWWKGHRLQSHGHVLGGNLVLTALVIEVYEKYKARQDFLSLYRVVPEIGPLCLHLLDVDSTIELSLQSQSALCFMESQCQTQGD